MFNHAGLELTNRVTAAFRVTFEGVRTIIILFGSLAFGWELWHNLSSSLQILGFCFVMLGVLVYNNILIFIPYWKKDNAVANRYKQFGSKNPVRTL